MTKRPFKGTLFGSGLPGAGIAATATWEPDGLLLVTTSDKDNPLHYVKNPAASGNGFNNETLRLSWQQEGAERVLILTEPAEQTCCRDTAPNQLKADLQNILKQRKNLESRFRTGGILLTILIILPLVLIGLFLANRNQIATRVVSHIPVSFEARLGDAVLAQSRMLMNIKDTGPAVESISTISKKLTTGSVHNYRFFVAERPEINAFAAPGGVVVVFRGLLDAVESPEELAGVLAHEVAHAELRHSLQGMLKSLGFRTLASIALGDSADSMLADVTKRLTELRFSRDAEREADANGLQRLVKARISPDGMVRFYQRLADQKGPNPPALLSTHPASGDRLDWLRNEVTKLSGPWQPLQVKMESLKQ